MTAITKFLALVERMEGYSDKAYPDPATGGRPYTIGYGTTRVNDFPVELGMACTREEASKWILDELYHIDNVVKQVVKVELNENQLAAIYDFCYNCGTTNFVKSTLLKKINQRDFTGAANEFEKWVYANGKILKGLVKRRQEEKSLFLS